MFNDLEGVIDAVYNPLRTHLIQSAKARDVRSESGLYMLVAQGVRAAEIFLGKKLYEKETDKVYKTILSSKENIVLTGMPGCGKSTIGKMLAEKLGRPFIDLDDEIVKMAGKPISEIFSEEGEKHFRDMETEAIKNVALISGAVIATGGGSVLRDENVRLLKQNGRIYFLDRPLEQILPTADRPLATSREAVINRYNERFSIYTATCDTHLKTDGIAEHTVEKIIKGF
jgi:shikimate dehydrogenase